MKSLHLSNVKKILLIYALIQMASLASLNAQNLKALGSGLKLSVACACADSTGIVYAVTKSGDTVIVNKWNEGTSAWSVYAKLNSSLATYGSYYTQCMFLNSKFYLLGKFDNNFSISQVYEYNGSAWTYRKWMKNVYDGDIRMTKFNNNIYFTGMFDSAAAAFTGGQAVKFNGSTFSSANFPSSLLSGGYSASTADVSNDTLFVTFKNKVLFHKAPSTWGTYYTHTSTILSLATANKQVYISDVNGNISTLNKGANLDSFATGKRNIRLKSFNNRVFLTHDKSTYDKADKFAEFKPNGLTYYFHNTFADSTDISLLNAGNQKLYYYNREGVFVKGGNYQHIAQVLTDSLKALAVDTILVKVFKDRNKNFAYDTTFDLKGRFYVQELSSRDVVETDDDGIVIFYPLEDEDFQLVYNREFQQGQDSCYGTTFSGALVSKTYNSPRRMDTLLMPLWRKSLQKRNLILRSWGGNRARLLDTMVLTLDAYSKDCDMGNASAQVKVSLDANTTFVSSIPAYTSKTGNVLTYQVNTINPYSKANIKIKIIYPNTKYSIGQKVRHYARLTTTFAEDSLDNSDSIVQKMVYSYDPNAKHCIPEGYISKELKSIRYHIDFQNLGTDDARRVTVVDTLNLNIPVYEFQMVGASHDYGVPTLRGNVITWVFDNINLKPKSEDEKASKGFVIFDAKVRGDLRWGDSIRNKAYIYFDYNSPVITNYAVIIKDEHSKDINELKTSSFLLYPNPAQDQFTLENFSENFQLIHIYDARGALIKDVSVNANSSMTVQTNEWAPGLYLLVTASGETIKILVE